MKKRGSIDPITVVIIISVVAIVSLGGYFISIAKKTGILPTLSNNASISPNILAITNPISSITGKVSAISNDSISIEIIPTSLGLPVPALNPAALVSITPTPKVPTSTIKLKISSSTSISKNNSIIPYLLKTNTTPQLNLAQPSKPSDIKIGDTVAVNTNTDLRVGNNHVAANITIIDKPNSISGSITKVSGDTIYMNGNLISNNPAITLPFTSTTKEFTIKVTNETEISGMKMPSNPTEISKPQKFSLSDLSQNHFITVYTDADVSSTNSFDALLISYQPPIPAPANTLTTSSVTPPIPLRLP